LRILITGGNGFIGSSLVESLAKTGHEVCVLDKNLNGNTDGLDCEKITGDIVDPRTFSRINTNPDAIFHAAAVSRVAVAQESPRVCFETNVMGTLNVMLWATGLPKPPHIILASSREVYGEARSFPVLETAEKKPLSVYGASKLAAENLVTHYSRTQGLDHTIIRFSNVYGSTRDIAERAIPSFVRNAIQGEPLLLFGGDQVLDFTHIEDVIGGLLNLLQEVEDENLAVVNNDFNFASGVGCSIMNLAELVKRVTNSHSEVRVSPGKGYDVRRFVGDWEKSKKCVKFCPGILLEDGLKRLVADMRE
jgi:nucleoside-diphosphate-sugar epimerase